MLCLVSLAAVPAHALDMSVGAIGWLSEWRPFFFPAFNEPGFASYDSIEKSGEKTMGEPKPLIGPVLGINFSPRWGLTMTGTYGDYGPVKKTYSGMASAIDFNGTNEIKASKLDVDATVNYNLTSVFKIFTGIKVFRYGFEEKRDIYESASTIHISYGVKGEMSGLMLGLGIGTTFRLFGNLYMLANVSANLLGGDAYYKETHYSQSGVPVATVVRPNKDIRDGNAGSWGGNGTIALAYYAESWSTTFTLGVRGQFIKYKISNKNLEQVGLTNKLDAFYGITFSAVYSFEL